ncbi:hypothetical protein [Neobacillus drentensis]|uniref:hypothetical protein n=1 Tax=Neobacillus drentensis TaxID=220684 RepID=UPI002FFE8539
MATGLVKIPGFEKVIGGNLKMRLIPSDEKKVIEGAKSQTILRPHMMLGII